MDTLGRRIRDRREARAWTQRDLAEKVGLSHGAVALYETGRRQPDLETLQRLAHVLGTSISYLVGETDDPSPPPRVSAAHETAAPGTPHTPEEQLIIERAVRNAIRELEEHKRRLAESKEEG